MTEAPESLRVVYLRGAGCNPLTWERVRAAMLQRGWYITHHRTNAWHFARGGAVVVAVDFTPTASGGLERHEVTVGRVQASYGHDRELNLQLASGGEVPRPEQGHLLDADALAELVAEQFDTVRHPDGPLSDGAALP